MTLEIHVMAWDRCGRAGLINGIQSLSLLIIGSPITIDINKPISWRGILDTTLCDKVCQ
jgi:hypothetical protein